MSYLTNKVIWITGASSGIGEALVYELSRKKTKLILSARRKKELERVKGNCPPAVQADIRILPLDLEKSDTLKLCVQAALQLFGGIDILINNGGIRLGSRISDTPLEADRKVMEINYFGAIALAKYLLPHFVSKQRGHFVNISSVTGIFGTPYRSAYAASKHALHGFFDSLRAEHHHDHVTVTMICPGFIQTSLPLSSVTASASASKPQAAKSPRMPVRRAARKIVAAISKRKQEVYIGGKEVFGVYLKRFFPSIFSAIIRKVEVR
ncbi:MAG TPA: SDR family oxidoreductase [Chryseosolibacter sp.]